LSCDIGGLLTAGWTGTGDRLGVEFCFVCSLRVNQPNEKSSGIYAEQPSPTSDNCNQRSFNWLAVTRLSEQWFICCLSTHYWSWSFLTADIMQTRAV